MNALWIAFVGGTLAFAHCLGMCGGFVLHLSGGADRRQVVQGQLFWHVGRLFTYVFLGACVGFLGAILNASALFLSTQRWLAYGTGAVMIVAGLALWGALPSWGRGHWRSGMTALLAPLYGDLFAAPTRRGAFVLGMATGFLPCPVVLGFLALASQHGSVAMGMATMAAFGAGTVGALAVLGVTGRMLSLWHRRWGAAVAGLVLVVLGGATMLRGGEAWHRVLGCGDEARGNPSTPACCCGER